MQENVSSSNEQSKLFTKHIELIKKSPLHWEIILNRPEKYNAITNEMYERITQILDEASKDEHLILLSITGKGKFYSSGTDLSDPGKAFSSTTIDMEAVMEQGSTRLKNFFEQIINFPKILIAFVNGPAIGVAVTILGLFDGVYASSSATFNLPFTRRAMSAEGCSSYNFPMLMGPLHAKEMILFGRKLTAQEAHDKGLVTRVIDENSFEQDKEKICQEVLSLPSGSLLASKALIQRWNIDILKKVNLAELNTLKERWGSEEFIEAMLTYMNEKQKSKL